MPAAVSCISGSALVCLDCLLDEHPDTRDAIDLARRERGVAIRDGDRWTIA
jgi:hypothetical protein